VKRKTRLDQNFFFLLNITPNLETGFSGFCKKLYQIHGLIVVNRYCYTKMVSWSLVVQSFPPRLLKKFPNCAWLDGQVSVTIPKTPRFPVNESVRPVPASDDE
jgi:hypothetical protein